MASRLGHFVIMRIPVRTYSKHQQKIIKNYYDNRDAISLQRAQELVTELYLSEGKKRQDTGNNFPDIWSNWASSKHRSII